MSGGYSRRRTGASDFLAPRREHEERGNIILSSGLRPRSTANCGWLRPCTLGSISFVRPKEMDERKGRPNGALVLRFALLPCRSRNGTSLCRARRAGIPPAPLRAGGQRLAMLERAIRGLEQHLSLLEVHLAGLAGCVGWINGNCDLTIGFVCWYNCAYRQVRHIPYTELLIYLINLLSF